VTENPKPLEIPEAQATPGVNGVFWLQGALLAGLFFSIFGSTMPPLYHDWRTFDTFSHGMLVPLISAYLAWQKRAQLRATPIQPSLWGITLIAPAVALAVVGSAVGDSFTERIAMVLCFAGLVWTLFGTAIFQRAGFALAYLFLMIPLPYVVVKEVAYHLRIVNAAMAAPMLRLLAVPVYRDGYFLHLPDITLEVADLCSGISSVFSLLALGAAYVYSVALRPAWKIVAVASTFPFAALINLFRIILTAALAYYVSPAVLGVLVHQMTGTITFFIALILFIALIEILQRRFARRIAAPSMQPSSAAEIANSTVPASGKSWSAVGAALAVMIAGGYFTLNVRAQADIGLAAPLDTIPLAIGRFEAAEKNTEGFYKDANAERDLTRKYAAALGLPIEVYVAFRGRQQDDRRLHSPKLQFPFGWNFLWIEPNQVASRSGTIHANWMLTQSNQKQVLVLYWYQRQGFTFSSETQHRLSQIRGAIFQGRTDGAVVRLALPVVSPENLAETKERLAAFAADFYPELQRVLPQ
jgi:EpsI family protein